MENRPSPPAARPLQYAAERRYRLGAISGAGTGAATAPAGTEKK